MNQLHHNLDTVRGFFEKLGEVVVSIEEYELFSSPVVDVHLERKEIFPSDVRHALNHLLGCLMEKEIVENRLVFDINSENKNKVLALQEKAKTIAARAKEQSYNIELEPMNSYERMVVHEAVKDIEGVETASQGEGVLRHIIVKSEKQKEE